MNSITIGRREDCDIVIEDGSASRLHAELVRKESKIYLRDKNSTNGTYIERNSEKQEVQGEMEVLTTDRLSFGTSDFFPLQSLLQGFTDRLFLRHNAKIEVSKKPDEKQKTNTETKKIQKFRCPSCGAIVSNLTESCESCFTQL